MPSRQANQKRRGVSNGGSRTVVRAAADMTSCEQVRQLFLHCRRSIGDAGGCLQVDLKGVDQADTKLMACLVAVYQLARAASVRMELSPSGCVLQMAEVCRLGWLIDQTSARPAGA
jgi:hypothetical protein